MSISRSRTLLILGVAGLCGCNGSAPNDLIGGARSTERLIFVKASAEETLNRTRAESNLYVLAPISPDGEVKPLTSFVNASVYDPCVSFDGAKVLFSMAPQPGSPRNIWEMNVDGSSLRKVTGTDAQGRDGDDFDPLYLPDGRIAFTSNRPGHLDEYNRSPAEVLHVANADGSGIEQISFNLSDDFDPFLLPDGMIGYTRWEHHGPQNRFPMFSTRPDGSGTFHLFGPHDRNFFHISNVPDGRLVAVMSTRVNGDAGELALLRLEGTRGDPIQPGQIVDLTPDIGTDGPPFPRGAFKYPSWIGEDRFVVSYSLPIDGGMTGEDESSADYGLYTVQVVPGGPDGETISNLTFLYNDPMTDEYDAQLVKSHDRPPVVPPATDPQKTSGVFAVASVYIRQQNDGQERPPLGSISRVMVVEGLPTRPGDPMDISTTEFERKRILGYAPVEADGSFHIEVPANTPIAFCTLDSLGRSFVTKRNWIYARPGEQFTSCTGCHGERGQHVDPNTIAMRRPPTDLVVPAGLREVINFKDTLKPVLDAKCVACHTPQYQTVIRGGVSVTDTILAGNLDLRMIAVVDTVERQTFPLAYLSLAGSEMAGMRAGEVSPGFSRRSNLIDYILGVGARSGQVPHPQGAEALTPAEKRAFITWTDLGAQYR